MRIISGKARGMHIEAPEGFDTRPTIDRVKEALFGRIQFRVQGAQVLDLFSGSGNLGLETASRGAEHVYLNDQNHACAQLIQKNADRLKLQEQVTVWALPYQEALKRAQANHLLFDIIFLDPPYGLGLEKEAIHFIEQYHLLAEEGCIILEHQKAMLPPEFNDYASMSTRNYGKIAITIYQPEGSKA